MAQSPEYPDLLWMPPKSWTDANRTSVHLIVIHTTEGSEGPTSAEDGAAYDQRRTDGTSTHYFHDSNSTVQCVRTADVAHAARHEGNLRGIQHELCGRAGQGGTGWADPVSQGTLQRAAKQCARDAKKWGIPVRHLTIAQVADGVKGFCGHYDITYAFPQDNGTHTDPGPDFPWSQFLDLVREEMGEHVALTNDDAKTFANADVIKAPDGSKNPDGSPNENWSLASYLYWGYKAQVQARDFANAALAAVKTLAAQDNVDEQAVAAAVAPIVAQGVTQAVLSALPQDIKGMTSDELGQAIQAGVQSGMRAVFADAAT
jgi:hypothetical protein